MTPPFIWGDRSHIMGILNVTPDSFSDGGQFTTIASALTQAQHLVAGGVDILDIGGQSTRPGAITISLEEEQQRVIPVIQALRAEGITAPISVDTTRSAVAQAALDAGANWINDISGGTYEPDILRVAADYYAPIVLMHLRGTPQTMQSLTDYDDVVMEVKTQLAQRVQAAITAGVKDDRIILDPGIGFAKTVEQNLALLRRLPELKTLGYPILLGPSRKSFIGHILQQPDPQKRVWGTAAACAYGLMQGADILRVHDGLEMVDVCRVMDRLMGRSPAPNPMQSTP